MCVRRPSERDVHELSKRSALSRKRGVRTGSSKDEKKDEKGDEVKPTPSIDEQPSPTPSDPIDPTLSPTLQDRQTVQELQAALPDLAGPPLPQTRATKWTSRLGSKMASLESLGRTALGWTIMAAEVVGGVAAVAAIALYAGQSHLIYQPSMPPGSRFEVPEPSEFGMRDWEEIDLISEDDTKVKAFVIYAPASKDDTVKATASSPRAHCRTRPTIIMLHANAGNVGHRLPLARVFVNRLRCNVVALSYRGYGRSNGSPSETGILLDAQTALDWTVSNETFAGSKIVLYGQSLGGAVAVGLAAGKGNADRLSGVILENTFGNLRKLIPAAMPLLAPFARLCHQTWRSDTRIFTIPPTLPFLFLSGSQDELIPPSHFRALYDLCPSTDKSWRRLVKGTHNDTCVQPGYWEFVSDFIRDSVLHRKETKSIPERKDTFGPGATKGTEEELKQEGAETLSRL